MTESTKIVGGLVNMRLKFPWSIIILQESLGLDLWQCIASVFATLTREILFIGGEYQLTPLPVEKL